MSYRDLRKHKTPEIKRKTEIQWAILDENIVVLKKPRDLTWKQFMAIVFRTFENDYALREIAKGFQFLESTSGLDFSKLGLGG